MNEAVSWWALSLALGCLCAFLSWPSRSQSIFGAGALLGRLPGLLPEVLYLAFVPSSLAATALALSSWLAEQSILLWVENLSGYARAIGVVLSLQAIGLLFHRRMYGAWALLLLSALSFQLWLFYQALGMDFSLLGAFYGATLFIFLVVAIALANRIDSEVRWAAARFCAFLLLALQWLFATGSRTIFDLSGFDWLESGTIYLTPLLTLGFVLAGFLWQFSREAVSGSRKKQA